VLIILLTTALAEEPAPVIVYQERTEIDFESLDITGELVKPEGNLITERTEAVFNPLIRLRTDWNEEMSASVNEIK
jgi:hypothetical protein